MPITVLVHLQGEDPIAGEIEELPSPTHTMIIINNPRRRDGKDVPYLERDVVQAIWPIHRITFIEIMPTAEEEKLIGFVRE